MAAARAARKTKKDVYELYSQALESVHKGAYKTALTTIGKIQKGFPNEIEVLARTRSLATVCERKIDGGASTGGSTLDSEMLFDQGVYHHNREEFEQAMDLFQKALKKDSKAGYIHYAMAATQARQGNTSEAVQHLGQAIAHESANRFRAQGDPDLQGLQDDESFRELMVD